MTKSANGPALAEVSPSKIATDFTAPLATFKAGFNTEDDHRTTLQILWLAGGEGSSLKLARDKFRQLRDTGDDVRMRLPLQALAPV